MKVYKKLERMLKVSEIKMGIDKVLNLAKNDITIETSLLHRKSTICKTMLIAQHQEIAKLFNEIFLVTYRRSKEIKEMR